MPTRKQILSKPGSFSPEELAAAVRDGSVTIYELSKTGFLTPMKRRRIEEILSHKEPPQEAEPEQAPFSPEIEPMPGFINPVPPPIPKQ